MGKKTNTKLKEEFEKIKAEENVKQPLGKREFEDDENMPKALAYFQKELDAIKSNELNCFFNNVIVAAPESFHNDPVLLLKIRRAYNILKYMMDRKEIQEEAQEALLGTLLISKILQNEFKDSEYPNLYPIATRQYISSIGEDEVLPRNLYENIIRAVESHLGSDSASIMLYPKAGSAEAEIANAFIIADLEKFL